MSGLKATPGPWKVFRASNGKLLGIGDAEAVGVTDAFGGLWRTGKEMEANADLIAASPDLYAALETFVTDYVDLVESGDAGFWDAETEPKVIAARAALAKARGETVA
jgi:hypothetical protein